MSRRRRAPSPTPSPAEVVDLLDALAHAGGLDVPAGFPFDSRRREDPFGRDVSVEASRDLFEADDPDLAQREVERLSARLEAISSDAEARWGQPAVHDRDLRLPADVRAPATFAEERRLRGFVRLRGWRRGLSERVLWLGVEHHGRELPVVLRAGITVWPGPLRAAADASPAPAPRRRAR